MKVGQAFRFHTACSLLIVGPSGSGKTHFTQELLLDNLHFFDTNPATIHYCYGVWQNKFKPMQKRGIRFHEGIPDSEDLPGWFPQGGLLVMDDLMDESSGDKRVLDLFTKFSHHQNITVLYLCQDTFPNGKYAKNISRNAHYIVTFKNPRDQLGVRNLRLQSFPTTWKKRLGGLPRRHLSTVRLFNGGPSSLVRRQRTTVESSPGARRVDPLLST